MLQERLNSWSSADWRQNARLHPDTLCSTTSLITSIVSKSGKQIIQFLLFCYILLSFTFGPPWLFNGCLSGLVYKLLLSAESINSNSWYLEGVLQPHSPSQLAVTEAETEAMRSSPLCSLFLNMLLKHNCTSQRDAVPNSSVDLVQNWEEAKGNTDSQSSCLHFVVKPEP